MLSHCYVLALFVLHPDPATSRKYLLIYLDVAALKYIAASINETALQYFILVNVYGVSAIIALVEIIILSSARQQKVRACLHDKEQIAYLLTLAAACRTY